MAIAAHTLYVQVFNAHHDECRCKTMTELVNGILPNISQPFMGFGQFGFRFRKVCAALGFSGARLIKATKAFS